MAAIAAMPYRIRIIGPQDPFPHRQNRNLNHARRSRPKTAHPPNPTVFPSKAGGQEIFSVG